MKKLISLLIAVLMVFGLLPVLFGPGDTCFRRLIRRIRRFQIRLASG